MFVELFSLDNGNPALKYQYAHKDAHKYIWYWRCKIECEVSSYDYQDISESIISRTEPDSTEIEAVILKFL